MSRSQLEAKWRSALKQPFPKHLGKPLLVPLLAYKLQEQAYGGLKPAIRRRLQELAIGFSRDGDKTKLAFAKSGIKPGTRLIRQWDGKAHHVTVLEQGFEYEGKRYETLSKIARLITHTRWSGPRFFGIGRGPS
jgi:hypothetical protein